MINLVRVKLPTGAEASVGESFAKTHGLRVLDKPADDPNGRAIADKPKTSVATAAEKKSSPKEDK